MRTSKRAWAIGLGSLAIAGAAVGATVYATSYRATMTTATGEELETTLQGDEHGNASGEFADGTQVQMQRNADGTMQVQVDLPNDSAGAQTVTVEQAANPD